MIKKTLFFLFAFPLFYTYAQVWQAPEQANSLKNIYALNDPEALAKGQKIFHSMCASCHGETGRGDVPSMQNLNPKPADLTSKRVQSQTDGAIFWKISEGKGLMASYKNILSEKDRWALVVYIRHLGKTSDKSPEKHPSAKLSNQKTLQNTKSHHQQKTVEAFPFSVGINMPTSRLLSKGQFGFLIQHRFGAMGTDEGIWRNFLGLDLAANIRFAFEIPLHHRINLIIGRTRYGKYYDFGIKYAVFRQTVNGDKPFALVFYSNLAVNTEKKPVFSSGATFTTGAPFSFNWYHRLVYDTQVIISRKFNENLSMQAGLEFIWRNLVPPYVTSPGGKQFEENNYTLALPLTVRYRTGLQSAILMEIVPNTHRFTMPFSLAYEIASSGNHVFQITLGNSDRILPQMLLTHTTFRPGKEGVALGFNLIRYF